MRIPERLRVWVATRAVMMSIHRKPDFVIGTDDNPYLRRWFVTPWSDYDCNVPAKSRWERIKRSLPNIYIHEFLRSDDDRALHDHPWWNLSILLLGCYHEHTIAAGGIHHRTYRQAGDMKFRFAGAAHRIEIARPCYTLFITGPSIRVWGFHCPQGWRPWKEFVDDRDAGKIGKGCG